MPDSRPYYLNSGASQRGWFRRLIGWFLDLTRFWIYIILFFAFMVICSYKVVSHYVRGFELETPSLIGLTAEEALTTLAKEPLGKSRLSVTLDHTQPHETAHKGTIISQQPDPKSRIKAGSPIKLVLSDGPPLVSVPDLTGQSRDRAATLLHRFNLKPGNESFMPRPNKPGGVVITTDPPAGTGVVEGSQVNLLLTAGASQSNEMPDLIGFTLEEVRETLKKRGLSEAEQVARIMGEEAIPGQVIDQMPKPGQLIQPDAHVIVYYVAPRPEPTIQPGGQTVEREAETTTETTEDEDRPETVESEEDNRAANPALPAPSTQSPTPAPTTPTPEQNNHEVPLPEASSE
jgi:beta-lactam-binding protein with PASTA domain